MGRLNSRIATVLAALRHWPRPKRALPDSLQRILIAHNLLLGDALMATALMAKLRQQYPAAHIAMTLKPALMPLYASRPYGVTPLEFSPNDPTALRRLIRESRAAGGYDVAYVLGDNRYSWLARALGARVVVAHAGDTPSRKNWPVDHLVSYPLTPHAWGDMAAMLVAGHPPRRYVPGDWPAPPKPIDFVAVGTAYALLHVGASTPLKLWSPERWRFLADALAMRGLMPVWSAGPGEQELVHAVAPKPHEPQFLGTLNLAGLWHLIAGARVLVCPDTGAAHLGRIVGTSTVALFGPGSATVSGPGDFFSLSSFRSVTLSRFECRDQAILFRRNIDWVRRCGRGFGAGDHQCARARCMDAIGTAEVMAAVDQALAERKSQP